MIHGAKEPNASWITLRRREDFYRLMAQNGLRVYPHWTPFTQWDDESVYHAWKKLFSKEPYPTAVMIPDPCLAASYRFLESRGLRIGTDISLIGMDDLPVTTALRPQVTSTVNHMDVAAQTAMENLNRLLDGESIPDVQHLPCELRVRESTGPVPKE
jgi:DNA-binding LacI/PurR family transcriptional regulator